MKFLLKLREILLCRKSKKKPPKEATPNYFRVKSTTFGYGEVWPVPGTVMVSFKQGEKFHLQWNMISEMRISTRHRKLTIETTSKQKFRVHFLSKLELLAFVHHCIRHNYLKPLDMNATFEPTSHAHEGRPSAGILKQFLLS